MWISGHKGIEGNKLTDKKAKIAINIENLTIN